MIIGIHGPINSGKNTIADYIMSKDEKYRCYAFAKPIKDACKVLFGFSDEQIEDRILKESIDEFWGFSPRRTMQLLGTEFGRNMLRDDIWIQRAEMEVNKNKKDGYSTIITDLRFENESEWIRSKENYKIIYIEVQNLIRDEKYQHTSEAGIKRYDTDIMIYNDKSTGLSNLHKQIDVIYEKYISNISR